MRDRQGVAGCSADTPIDLVSDDDEVQFVRVQVPVASGSTRAQTSVQKPVRSYRTRAVARAQPAAESPGIQARLTPRAGASVDPSSRAHARVEAGDPAIGNTDSSPTAELPLQHPIRAHHTRSDERNDNEAASATSSWQSPPEAASRRRKPDSFIDHKQIHTDDTTYSNPGHTRSLSGGPLRTRGSVNSEAPAAASAFRHDVLMYEPVTESCHRASSAAAEASGPPCWNRLSRPRSNNEEGMTATLASQQSLLTLNTLTRRKDGAANSATENSGNNMLTRHPRISMERNGGAAASSAFQSQLIDQQGSGAQYENSTLQTTLAGTVNRPGAQLSKKGVLTHEDTNWAGRRGIQDMPFDMKQQKLSAIWSFQSTEETLTIPKRNEVFPYALKSARQSDEDVSALPPVLFQQPATEKMAITEHEEIAMSTNAESSQDFVDASYIPLNPNRILPKDRAENQGRAGVYSMQKRRIALHETKVSSISRTERLQTKKSKKKRKELDPDVVVITGTHRNFKFWKQQAAKELQIGPQMQLVTAAVALFDKRQIQTVVPNRYLRTGISVKQKHRRTLTFPGTVEILQDSPITAVKNAYREHTDEKLDTSRLVLWTDGSATGSRYSEGRRGFAVTWRRSTATGWGLWEAIGFQGAFYVPFKFNLLMACSSRRVARFRLNGDFGGHESG
jgi:hypothetical protein